MNPQELGMILKKEYQHTKNIEMENLELYNVEIIETKNTITIGGRSFKYNIGLL